MSPISPKSKRAGVDRPLCEGDCCSVAVKRAYNEMLDQGQPEQFARQAAVRVFRWHHSDTSPLQAEDAVALWLHDGTLH